MTNLAGSTSAKTPMFVLGQGSSARSSVGRYANAEKCHPRASRRLAFREAEKSQLFTPVRQSFAEWRLKFALGGQLRRGGCGQVRRRHTGQVLGNDGRIEVFDSAVAV